MVVFHQVKQMPGNENEKGLQTLLTEALEMKPLADLPNPLDFDWVDTAKNWNLKDTLNDVSGLHPLFWHTPLFEPCFDVVCCFPFVQVIRLLLPPKKSFEFDIPNMVQRGLVKNKVPESVQRLIIKDTSQCGIRDPDNPENFDGKCSFVFPQMFKNTSSSNRDSALQIRRRDGGLGTFEEQAAQAAAQAAQTGGGRRLGRRLGRRRLHPLNAHVVSIPANVPLQTLKHPTSKHTRRLDGVSIPSDAFTKEGGSCSLTTGDDFPKTITCNVEMLIKPSTFMANQSHFPDITANVRAQCK